MARYSKAHNKATQKYQEKVYYRFSTCIPKDIEEIVKDRAKKFGSINAYVNHLISTDIKKDGV